MARYYPPGVRTPVDRVLPGLPSLRASAVLWHRSAGGIRLADRPRLAAGCACRQENRIVATPVESALRRAVADLNARRIGWALVGGLAVSVRAIPRFTRDLDFTVAVAGDPEAENIVHRPGGRGYRPVEVLEQEGARGT